MICKWEASKEAGTQKVGSGVTWAIWLPAVTLTSSVPFSGSLTLSLPQLPKLWTGAHIFYFVNFSWGLMEKIVQRKHSDRAWHIFKKCNTNNKGLLSLSLAQLLHQMDFYFVIQKLSSSGGCNSNSHLIQNILFCIATFSSLCDSEGFSEFCHLSSEDHEIFPTR